MQKSKLKILYITEADPADKAAISGIAHNAFKSLTTQFDVEWIGQNNFSFFQNMAFVFIKALSIIFRFTYPRKNTLLFSKLYAKNMQKVVNSKNYDVVFATLSSSLIANLNFNAPIIYFTDATFAIINNYYFKNVPASLVDSCNSTERMALSKSAQVIVTSEWAKTSAVDFYNINPDKISIVDFGSNLNEHHAKQQVGHTDKLELLFIGVNWERKNGELTYSVFKELRKRGLNVNLTIVGCAPNLPQKTGVVIIPFLDKNNLTDYARLIDIWTRTHFLILPSKADCTPIVFSEAASFGVPVLSTNTGGIKQVIQQNVNGFIFDLDTDFTAYADKIQFFWDDKDKYALLSNSSYAQYVNRLSWDVWTKKVAAVINASV